MKKIVLFTTLVLSLIVINACSNTRAAENTTVGETVETLDLLVLENQYALNVKLFNNVLKDINEAEANLSTNNQVNSIKWIAGHTLDTQYNIAAILGIVTDNPYASDFGFGKPFKANTNYPTLSKMLNDWNGMAIGIQKALSEMNQEQLNAPSPFPIPYKEQTIRGLLAFQMHHMGYEIGQIGLYRRIKGKSAMSYQ